MASRQAYIVFDGGYISGLKMGAWAVVLVDRNKHRLVGYGIEEKSKSSDMEWIAAHAAMDYGRKLGVRKLKGDFKACIEGMQRDYPEFHWEWIPSKSNVADKYAKPHQELV
jgi:ribonuclease HI